MLAEVNKSVEECARCQHHGPGTETPPVAGQNAGHAAINDDQILHAAFHHRKVVYRTDLCLHRLAIELAVGLRARPVDRGPF